MHLKYFSSSTSLVLVTQKVPVLAAETDKTPAYEPVVQHCNVCNIL